MSEENKQTRITISITEDQLEELDRYVTKYGLLNRSAAIRQLISDKESLQEIQKDLQSQRKAINHMDRQIQIIYELISSIIGENGYDELYPSDSKDAPTLVRLARNYVGQRIHTQSLEKLAKEKQGGTHAT